MLHIHNDIPEPESIEQALDIQTRLARELHLGDRFRQVAGVAVVYGKDEKNAYVVAVVLSTTNWRPISEQSACVPVERPFDPEMTGWREAPLILERLLKLPIDPDIILVEGNGIAHPRKFGLACHVGYALDHPTVGVSQLWPPGCRDVKAALLKRRGSKSILIHNPSGDRVGYEAHTQDNVAPIYVSPGHRVSIEEAVSVVLRCAPWYPLPEPIRVAKESANKLRQKHEGP